MILKRSIHILYKSLVLSLLVMLSMNVSGQGDDLVVYGVVRDADNSSKLEAITCVVKQDGKSFDNMASNKNGKYEFDMPLGYVYSFRFSMAGYAHKIIEVDTKSMNPEDHKGGFEMNMDITLFEVSDEFDLSIMDVPFGKATFDNIRNDLSFDFDYTEKRNIKVEDEIDRVDKLLKNMAKNLKDFDELVRKGDDKMIQEKYEEAVMKYTDALKIFPNDEPVRKKLDNATAMAAEANKDQENESKYQGFLADGSKFMKSEDWAEAKESYQKASDLKPGERVPKDKIAEIDNILMSIVLRGDFNELVDAGDKKYEFEDYEASIKKYEDALEIFPNETYPRDQINKAKKIIKDLANANKEADELEKEYNELIKFAQKNVKNEEYLLARDKYQEASDLKPEEELPIRKIKEINDILDELAEMKEKDDADSADKAESDRIEREYQAFVQKGNDLFKEKDLEQARREYEGALSVKPEDKHSLNRIEKIDEMLDDLAENAKKQDDEDNANAEQEAIDRQYDELLSEADGYYDIENLEKALEKYEAALEVKNKEKYPKSRINQIKDRLAEDSEDDDNRLAELARKKSEEEDERLAEEERLADELAEKERLLDEKKNQKKEEDDASTDTSGREYFTVDELKDLEVLKYYRDAKRSGDLAKIDDVHEQREKNDKLHSDMSSLSNKQRQDNIDFVDEKFDDQEALALKGGDTRNENILNLEDEEKKNSDNIKKFVKDSDKKRNRNVNEVDNDKSKQENISLNDIYRDRRIEDNKELKQDYEDQVIALESKGDASRVDNMFEIETIIEKSNNINDQGEVNRLENVDQAKIEKKKQDDYSDDLINASQVKRESSYSDVENDKDDQEDIGNKYELKLLENQSDIEKEKNKADSYSKGLELDASLRRIDAADKTNDKYRGEEKDPEDYLLNGGGSDIRYGVTESSTLQGNKTIIERTVREGNIIDVYKKVISKTGIYYFKNGKSCTENIWELETVRVFD